MIADAIRLLLTWAAYAAVLATTLYVVGWPIAWAVRRRHGRPRRARGQPGGTRDWRPWAAWVLAVAGLAVAAPPLSDDVERRARIAKARGDVLLMGKAVSAYAGHCGGPPAPDATGSGCRVATRPARGPVPTALLMVQRNARGAQAGPFLAFVPRLPAGWTGVAGVYAYVVDADRRAGVCAAGDGVVADSRGGGVCP